MRDPRYFRNLSYDRKILPNAFLSELEAQATTIQEATEATGYTIGMPGWMLLYSILYQSRTWESGYYYLEGTNDLQLILAQALKDAQAKNPKVLTFELEKSNLDIAKERWEKAGVGDIIHEFMGPIKDTFAPALSKEVSLKSCRIAFLDASHLEEDIEYEFQAILPYMASDGIIIMDNTYQIAEQNENQRVNGFLRNIRNRFGGNIINLPFCSWYTPGIAIWQLEPNLDPFLHWYSSCLSRIMTPIAIKTSKRPRYA